MMELLWPLEPDDECILALARSRNTNALDYANARNFVTQSTFFGGHIHLQETGIVLATKRHPKQGPPVITQWFGPKGKQTAATLAETLAERGEKVIIKNIGQSERDWFVKNGFHDYREADGWSPFFRFDDDTYPQCVLDLGKTTKLAGPGLKTLRYHVKRFKRENDWKLLPLTPERRVDAMTVHADWSRDYRKRHARFIQADPSNGHSVDLHRRFILDPQNIYNAKDLLSFVLYANERPCGFSLLERVSRTCVGLYSSIAASNKNGISETLILESLREAHEAGYRHANLGGSEFSSLHRFKLKFEPVQFIQKTHLVKYPRQSESAG